MTGSSRAIRTSEAYYHERPGYWVEPVGPWGEGRVALVELPTENEVHDNIVAYWQPRQPYEQGQEVTLTYRMRSIAKTDAMHPGGKVVNTFQAPARASGSGKPGDPTERRFMIDFAGGDLAFFLKDPGQVQLVPSTSAGQITHTFLIPNEHTEGFRAAIDVKLEPGPEHRSARLPACRQPGADRNVDISLVGRLNATPTVEAARRPTRRAARSRGRVPDRSVSTGARSDAPCRSPTIHVLVIEADGIAGYAMVHLRGASAVARLTSLAIRAGSTGGGLGRRLLASMEAEARRRGCGRLRLEVRADNSRAQRLYEAAGYRRFAIEEDYYEDGEPAWRYEKALVVSSR